MGDHLKALGGKPLTLRRSEWSLNFKLMCELPSKCWNLIAKRNEFSTQTEVPHNQCLHVRKVQARVRGVVRGVRNLSTTDVRPRPQVRTAMAGSKTPLKCRGLFLCPCVELRSESFCRFRRIF